MGNKNQEINYNLQCAPVPLRATTFQPHFLSLMWRERATALRWQPPAPREPLPAPLGPLGPPLVGLETAGGSSNDTSRGAMWLPRLPQTPPLVWISFPSACHEPVELHNPSVTWDTAACYNTCGSTRPSTWLSFVGENLILETGFLVSTDLCVRLMPDSSDLKSQIDCQSISAWLLILIDDTCNATNKVKYLQNNRSIPDRNLGNWGEDSLKNCNAATPRNLFIGVGFS